MSEDESIAGIVHATGGSVRTSSRGKWILTYAMLATLLLAAIASLKFRSGQPNRPGTTGVQSTPPAPARTAPSEPREPQSTGTEPFAAKNNVPDTQSPAQPVEPSAEPAEPRIPHSPEEQSAGSSSAEAIRAERPQLPAGIKSAITSDNTVDVRVTIDESGRVIAATPVLTSGPMATSLVRYAVEAARRWRFKPARQNGEPVRSGKVLEFLFRPSDS